MTLTRDQQRALEVLDSRLRILLPEDYEETYEQMEPAPMRSAGLKYGADGTVAWERDGQLLRPGDCRRPAAQGRHGDGVVHAVWLGGQVARAGK